MPNPYLKVTNHPVRSRRREERRLGILFSLTVLAFALLVVYYFPQTTAQRTQLLQEGYRRWQNQLHPQLIDRGLTCLPAPEEAAWSLHRIYELPAQASLPEFQRWLEPLLRQNGYQFRRARPDPTIQAYTVFLSFQGLALGAVCFRQPQLPTAQPVQPSTIIPRLAIVIDDFGNSNNAIVQGFLALDLSITISVIPGHDYSRWVAQQAKSAGKEVIVHMPMEPEGDAYQGGEDNYILRTNLSEAEILKRIDRALAELPEASGLNNHMGSRFTADARLMSLVMHSLKRKGIYFIDSLTSPRSVAYETARANGVPAGLRTVFLDNIRDKSEIKAQFDKAVAIAKRSGKALVIGHVHPETLEVLQALQPQDIAITFASQIVE